MSLTTIVQEIERRAESQEFGKLQAIRKELQGFQRLPSRSIFHPSSINEQGGYAFHYGGRKELQFNVGFQDDGLRHGVAFSFETSRTLPDYRSLIPNVARFNEFLMLYPHQYSDLLMWHWHRDKGDSTKHSPVPISSDLIKPGMFVFMGRLQSLDALDFDLIMEDFDRLLPLYNFVQGSKSFPEPRKTNRSFQFQAGCTSKPFSTIANEAEKKLDVRLRHNEIQIGLHRHLVSIHGRENVGTENKSISGNIDLVVRKGHRFWFYEIKTSMSARGCIREGFAQLLEYSFWPGAQNADRLVIVGESSLDMSTRKYLATLKKRFAIPLEYVQFDVASGAVIE